MKKLIPLLLVLLSFNIHAGGDSEYDHLVTHVSEKDQLRLYLSWNRWGEETGFNSIEDYRNYLSRLNAQPRVIDTGVHAIGYT